MRHMIDLFANSEATLMANVFEVRNFDNKHQWRRQGDETGGEGGRTNAEGAEFLLGFRDMLPTKFSFLGSKSQRHC